MGPHQPPWDPPTRMGPHQTPWDPPAPMGPHQTHGTHQPPWDPTNFHGTHQPPWDPTRCALPSRTPSIPSRPAMGPSAPPSSPAGWMPSPPRTPPARGGGVSRAVHEPHVGHLRRCVGTCWSAYHAAGRRDAVGSHMRGQRVRRCRAESRVLSVLWGHACPAHRESQAQ